MSYLTPEFTFHIFVVVLVIEMEFNTGLAPRTKPCTIIVQEIMTYLKNQAYLRANAPPYSYIIINRNQFNFERLYR